MYSSNGFVPAKRILLLTYAFPPMALPEAYLSAKTMGNMLGCDVDVICADAGKIWQGNDSSLEGYVSAKFKNIYRISQPLFAKHFRFRWLPLLANLPDILVFSNRRMYKTAQKLVPESYDAIVSWSQWHSVHLVALSIKERNPSLRWMAHFSDPWVDNPYVKHGLLLQFLNERMESNVIEKADRLSFTSDQTANLVMRKYPAHWKSKVSVHPHPFDPTLYDPKQEVNQYGPFVIRYIGAFYGERSPYPLFRALQVITEKYQSSLDGVVFELVGLTPIEFLQSSEYLALPNGLVTFVSQVNYLTSLQLMLNSNALLLIDAPGSESIFLPSKLIDYIGAGRPIFGITPPGASADLIRQLGGFVANPSDEIAIVDGILRMLEALRGGCFTGTWGEDEVRNRFSIERVSSDFRESIFQANTRTALEAN